MRGSLLIDSVGPSKVTIDSKTSEVLVAAYQRGITLAVPGPQGPPGPAGGAAAGVGAHGRFVSVEALQEVVAASADFEDFQSRISDL